MLDLRNVPEERLDYHQAPVVRSSKKPSLAVDILSIATATPKYKVSQTEAFERVKSVSDAFARFEGIYTSSAIETSYSCVPPDWCEEPHGWSERMVVYQKEALALLEDVATRSVEDAELSLQDINVIVTNSTTGMVVPRIDALLINRLKLKETVTRLPIFGFGCSGGAAGLARAAQLAQMMPGANVLFLTIDLCSLAVRANDHSLTNFVAAALFGDGAAAVVLATRAVAAGPPARRHRRRGSSRPESISVTTQKTISAWTSRTTDLAWCSAPICQIWFGPTWVQLFWVSSTETIYR